MLKPERVTDLVGDDVLECGLDVFLCLGTVRLDLTASDQQVHREGKLVEGRVAVGAVAVAPGRRTPWR